MNRLCTSCSCVLLKYQNTRGMCRPCYHERWHLANKDRRAKASQARYLKNKGLLLAYSKQHYRANRQKRLGLQRQYRETHKEEISATHKKYYATHRKEIIARTAKTFILRLKTDIQYRLKDNLRRRIRKALKGRYKFGSAVQDIGCSIPELRRHLERQFSGGMTWENYGQWHIDHIFPLSRFDLTNPEQFKKACHYTNLQPLWARDNLKKRANLL